MDDFKIDAKNPDRYKAIAEPTKTVIINGAERRHKVGRTVMTLRVQQVVSWLLDGVPTIEVVKRVEEKWGVGRRQAYRYVDAANEQVEAVSAQEVKGATTLALFRLTELYHAAMSSGDLKVALDIVKAQARMLGLNAPEKFETKAVDNWDSMDIAQQLEHVAGIVERAEKTKKASDLN